MIIYYILYVYILVYQYQYTIYSTFNIQYYWQYPITTTSYKLQVTSTSYKLNTSWIQAASSDTNNKQRDTREIRA